MIKIKPLRLSAHKPAFIFQQLISSVFHYEFAKLKLKSFPSNLTFPAFFVSSSFCLKVLPHLVP